MDKSVHKFVQTVRSDVSKESNFKHSIILKLCSAIWQCFIVSTVEPHL